MPIFIINCKLDMYTKLIERQNNADLGRKKIYWVFLVSALKNLGMGGWHSYFIVF